MSTIKDLLGKRIRELREQKGLTQEALATMVGIEPPSLSSIERGNSYPTAETMENIAKSLNVLPCELFTFEHINIPPVENARQEIIDAISSDEDLAQKMYIVLKNLRA
ncbi:MAG: helix-turn-helix domain-containing protein [Muribaculaceae bacterium]|nr:helix-turn-helix domain-containing protein [Muribaculaceae bacterium]